MCLTIAITLKPFWSGSISDTCALDSVMNCVFQTVVRQAKGEFGAKLGIISKVCKEVAAKNR